MLPILTFLVAPLIIPWSQEFSSPSWIQMFWMDSLYPSKKQWQKHQGCIWHHITLNVNGLITLLQVLRGLLIHFFFSQRLWFFLRQPRKVSGWWFFALGTKEARENQHLLPLRAETKVNRYSQWEMTLISTSGTITWHRLLRWILSPNTLSIKHQQGLTRQYPSFLILVVQCSTSCCNVWNLM